MKRKTEGRKLRPPKNSWPAGEASASVLFIAQLFREMLTASTYESFRVSTLDIKSRIREMRSVLADIKQERIPIISIEPCLNELYYTISSDPIAEKIVGREIEMLMKAWPRDRISEKTLKLYSSFMLSLYNKLEKDYKSELEIGIIETSKLANQKDKIKSLVNLYCSLLINDGYSPDFILSKIQDRFFNKDIKKVERRTLARFFASFSNSEFTYQVFIPVSSHLGSYAEKMGMNNMWVKPLTDLPSDAQVRFSAQKDFDNSNKYFVVQLERCDPYSALSIVNEILSSIVAMTYLGKRTVNLQWRKYGYVKLRKAAQGEILVNRQIVFQKKSNFLGTRIIKELTSTAKNILTEFNPQSMDRLLSAVNISALSRSSQRPENQLITLWSAIEVLLSDPPRGVPRIVHYVDMLTPCICIKYARRYIVAIVDELRVHHSKHLRDFFKRSEFEKDVDIYTNFTRLVFEDALKPLHQDFCAPMGSNPLALYRLWKLEKNFGTRGTFLKSLETHENRVRWQLHRIYRTRNSIVHSGRIPSFLSPLVMNVSEYLRGSLIPILNRASSLQTKADIDQIVSEIRFDYELIKSELNDGGSKSKFTQGELGKFHR